MYCNCTVLSAKNKEQSAALKELEARVDDLQGRLDTAIEERSEFEQQVIALNESTKRYKTELARIQADAAGKSRAAGEVLNSAAACARTS